MRRKQDKNRSSASCNDANYAAGSTDLPLMSKAPDSRGVGSVISATSDIEFYEDLISDPVLVLGMDITHLSRNGQFIICASGVFFFQFVVRVSARTLVGSTLQSKAWSLPCNGAIYWLYLPCLHITKLRIPKTESRESDIHEFKLERGSLWETGCTVQAVSWVIYATCC